GEGETAAARAVAETRVDLPKLSIQVGKIQIKCPGCDEPGLLDVRNLGKTFRCPACDDWWRMDAAGQVVEAAPPTGAAARPAPAGVPAPAKAGPVVSQLAPPAPPAPLPGRDRAAAAKRKPAPRARKGSPSVGDLVGLVWTKGGLRVMIGVGAAAL